MKKKILIVLILLLALFTQPVFAKGSNFNAGESVSLTEDTTSTTFAAGNVVEANNHINGIGFIAGNIVSVSGSSDYLFAAGNNVTVTNETTKDMFLAGNSITVKNVNVRDLYAAGTTIRLDSRVTNNAYLGADNVYINSEVDGNLFIAAENIKIGDQAVIHGTLEYPKESKISIAKSAIINAKKVYEGEQVKEVSPVGSIIVSTIISYVSMLLIAFILLALYKNVFVKISKMKPKAEEILKTLGIGLIALIVVPVVAGIVMVTLIGIPLSIIALILYSILLYLSIIPTSYYLGNVFLKDRIKSPYLLILVSLLCMYILKTIPYLGGIIEFLSIIFGLGIFVLLLKDTVKTK